ncbi:MAG TPA: hypothetical protein VGX28_05620 [Frankiaceae bacterium]|jgi:hypothetical protein|nr:hypothetical protein [Frankiaceae bacterium]
MNRRLSLKSEYVAELTHDELAVVVAALPTQFCTGAYRTINVQECLTLVTDLFTGTTTTG